jgi:hypothetical protein
MKIVRTKIIDGIDYSKILTPKIKRQISEAIKAARADGNEDVYIDYDRFTSDFGDTLTAQEYAEYDVEQAEGVIAEELARQLAEYVDDSTKSRKRKRVPDSVDYSKILTKEVLAQIGAAVKDAYENENVKPTDINLDLDEIANEFGDNLSEEEFEEFDPEEAKDVLVDEYVRQSDAYYEQSNKNADSAVPKKSMSIPEEMRAYFRKHKTYDGFTFKAKGRKFRVTDNRQLLTIISDDNKVIYREKSPYLHLYGKLQDSLTAYISPGLTLFNEFQARALKDNKGQLNVGSYTFDLEKEKDSFVVTQNGIDIVFDNIAGALRHIRCELKNKLGITDAVFAQGDEVTFGEDEAGNPKTGVVESIEGDEVTVNIDGVQIKTTQDKLGETVGVGAEGTTDSIKEKMITIKDTDEVTITVNGVEVVTTAGKITETVDGLFGGKNSEMKKKAKQALSLVSKGYGKFYKFKLGEVTDKYAEIEVTDKSSGKKNTIKIKIDDDPKQWYSEIAEEEEIERPTATSLKDDVSWEHPQFDELVDLYVPAEGPAETELGEILRAISRILYRYLNDGDVFWRDYGIETAGSAAIYLSKTSSIRSLFVKVINEASIEESDQIYYRKISRLRDIITGLPQDKLEELAGRSNMYDSVTDFYEQAKQAFGDPDDDYYDDEDDDW